MSLDLNKVLDNLPDQEKKEEKQENKVYGVRQALLQGASFGQAPHIWGISQALGGAIGNIANRKNPLKDLYSDYKEGREEFKKEYKTFEDKNKGLAFGGDLVGGLATGGIGTKAVTKLPRAMALLNSTKLLQSPITRATLVGGAFGGGYGASNTLGKGFDFGSSLLGAGTGAVLGGGLGKVSSVIGSKAKQLLGGKEKALLEGGEKVTQLEGKEIPQLTNAEKILLKEGDIPKNVVDITPSQELKANFLPKTEGIKDIVTTKTKNPFGTGYFMDGIDILVPEGMENKNFRAFLKSPLIQEEARKGLIGRKWETYQNQAADEFRKMNKEIKKVVENAYNIIPDDTVIPLTYDKNNKNVVMLAQEEINKLANKKVTTDQKLALKKAQELLNKIEATITEKDGNIGIEFGNIKDATQQFNSYAELFENKKNRHAKDMFKKIYNIFANYRDTNPEAQKATELYRDFKSINKTLGEIGFDVEKVSNNNNIETRIQVQGRGRAGQKLNKALDKVAQILNKYPELEQFKGLRDKVNLAQVSYDARPSDNSKLLNAFSFLRPIQTIRNISDRYTNPQAQEQLKVLASRIKTGKVNPKDFENIEILRGGDFANRNYYRKKAYGDVLETLKSNLLNKDIIEK